MFEEEGGRGLENRHLMVVALSVDNGAAVDTLKTEFRLSVVRE